MVKFPPVEVISSLISTPPLLCSLQRVKLELAPMLIELLTVIFLFAVIFTEVAFFRNSEMVSLVNVVTISPFFFRIAQGAVTVWKFIVDTLILARMGFSFNCYIIRV